MLHAVPSPPAEVPQAPAQIMTGLYLQCLREAYRIGLEEAALTVRVSPAAVSRWERAHSPIRPDALTTLLRHYGVADDELDFMVRSLPPLDDNHSRYETQGSCRSTAHDRWADVAGDEAAARLISLMRSATTVVQYCMVVPVRLRTRDYQQALLDPAVCISPDEPAPGLPAWVHHVPWASDQRWTVLLDETVLTRGRRARPATLASQLRHLANLTAQETPTGPGATIRILPLSEVLFIQSVGPAAEVTLHGHRMVVRNSLFPCYETGSRTARVISAGLREAADAAWSRDATHGALMSAAEDMERKSIS
ncbi:Scr1 family TA system antitoxin-like transcriptional regulator [Streptomyces zhihengii]|uniref:Helix-turn-helix transcriptional regulator n=1 Tax=Streptomyces zhihengii TaxID=1818004 RepID=A0ABS2V4N6_9ACTN|nr:Scr1 family TA system antitoxin-like transcriptional regulator [Streptomyces zhihengii]MBM9624644.1 helix-turn-helix transcriptional regulator [Streptomyces zhihengii]